MKIIFSQECLKYIRKGHPESPERVKRAYELLKDKYPFVKANQCSDKELLLCHSLAHVNSVKEGAFSDADTPNFLDILEYAKLSAGAAIQAAELALVGEKAFSLMRPPGHHASASSGPQGFCYFNNIAIAVSKMLKEKKVKKAAILDIDVHHGNGTQDIFLGNDKVLYISLHQSPLYPETGLVSEKNCINYPLPSGTSEQEYLDVLEKALEKIQEFNPDILGISAGFDTFKEDPLASLQLEIESYEKIGKMINSCNINTFAVLEGGYSSRLGECIHAFLKGIEK